MSPSWPTTGAPTPREAAALQLELRERVREEALPKRIELVAGLDVAVGTGAARAAACVLTYPELELVEECSAERALRFPYVPGLLGFREVPALVAAFEKLRHTPDVLLVDGHGRAHPRRFGVACHLGVELDLPAIGCGKSLFVGEHRDPAPSRGSRAQLRHEGELIGYALRTRERVKPIYVSIGHRVELQGALRFVLACSPRYRIPEPVRRADALAGAR